MVKPSTNKEQCERPPQAARSFAAILQTAEIMQLLKIDELKVAVCRSSAGPSNLQFYAHNYHESVKNRAEVWDAPTMCLEGQGENE